MRSAFSQARRQPLCPLEPPVQEQHHSLHWLKYAGDPEVWRWKAGAWHSIHIQVSFTPGEMADQQWRYHAPCVAP